ncbi:hypothetical protein EI42_06238 [Thermosporothrix hazakensis]|uniref:Uncharacterized protein n=1 Tax=Thermosporothrix hazakensis TaxID=644383 RepID=A0A326TSY2_THEHA|nr:hypothetical protein EI42_06238 [Thermosporothrix hazakensis]GCE51448.1 hypothetical protein KTH_63170 [Thermosporothrix hazakensis]
MQKVQRQHDRRTIRSYPDRSGERVLKRDLNALTARAFEHILTEKQAQHHLFIKGAMHLKEFFAERRETEEDLFFVGWQRFLGNEVFGD